MTDGAGGERSREPAPTRREEPIQRDGGSVGVTRREALAAGRETELIGAGSRTLLRLPAELEGRYRVVGELSRQGGEADLLHVEDGSGAAFVVKVYRRGVAANRQVWDQLGRLDSEHVVRIHETGHSDDRDYEVIEFVAGGSLRDWLGRRPAPPPAETVTDIVRQLAAGLNGLHGEGIVHRDLKPENVLVRGERPLHLVLADFGLSRVLDASMAFSDRSMTVAFAAPEALAGQVSPARDWWSLGMIVLELVTARHPYAGMTDLAVLNDLATRAIDTTGIDDPRLRLLCRGLLVRDPVRRWGGDQVRRWLEGDSPPVVEHVPTGLSFRGRRYADRARLAAALAADWTTAVDTFLTAMGTPEHPGDSWRALRDWLREFDAQDDDADIRRQLLDQLARPQPSDVKLVRLLRWLDPGMMPHYRGLRIDEDDLPRLGRETTRAERSLAGAIVIDLHRERLLPLLATFDGAGELAEVDRRWLAAIEAWDRLAADLRRDVPALREATPTPVPSAAESPAILGMLLALASDPTDGREELRATLSAIGGPAADTDWFGSLAASDADPLRLVAAIRCAPVAAAVASDERRRRQECEERAAALDTRWQEREHARLRARSGAMGWAAACASAFAGLWLVGTYGFEQLELGQAPALPALVAWAVQSACELGLAAELAGDYHPRWSALRGLRIGWSAAWAWLGATLRGLGAIRLPRANPAALGCAGCLGVIAFFALLSAVATLFAQLQLWIMFPAAAMVAHMVWTIHRLGKWRQAHAASREEALDGAG